jgi:Saccharopine dehydrogenase NADP binding domain
MTADLKILIVGGYGIFGGRIVELLEDEPRLTVLVAGRSAAKAKAFVASRGQTKAQLQPYVFDRNADVGVLLSPARPDILVDASGPFQAYGGQRYRIVEACLEQKVHYLDLADGSEFAAGISAFDNWAKSAGIFILSGASSFPVLTAAAVRRLSIGMSAVKAIRGGIAPSPFAGVGENVVRAISAYAGEPLRRKRNGAVTSGYAFTEQSRYTVSPPGLLPLRSTLFSLVDVPDLLALPAVWPEADDVWMGAGPVPEVLHRLLIGLAWLRRWRLLPTLSQLAPLMYFTTNHIRWGEHRGGMFVEIEGLDQFSNRLTRSWHLLAEGDDGPLIPSMAVEAIVRDVLEGRVPAAGARTRARCLRAIVYEANDLHRHPR